MKKKVRYVIMLVAILVLIVCILSFNKQTNKFNLQNIKYTTNSDLNTNTEIHISKINEENYLFLPSSANLKELKLTLPENISLVFVNNNGEKIQIKNEEVFDFEEFYGEKPLDNIYKVQIKVKRLQTIANESLNIMKSENISSMYIVSEDNNKAREYIESDSSHNITAKGTIALIREDNTAIFDGNLKEIKGRGNSTWAMKKKPYQLKFDEKVDLLETENSKNKSKKWVLLANYMDTTSLHNQIAYNMGKEIGLKNSPDCKMIDLYYDGEYRGNYLLSEKVEVSDGRVEIHDLEKDFEKANEEIEDFDELETKQGQNKFGNTYQCVVGINTPKDISGGYLLEIDDAYYKAEKSWFTIKSDYHFVVKGPEFVSEEAMIYISNFVQEVDECIRNKGVHPVTGKKIEEYIDVKSFAKYILIQEITKNCDAFSSSTFFYKPEGEDKLYAGPIWDFDTGFGVRYEVEDFKNPENLMNRYWCYYITEVPKIRIEMQKYYNEDIYPMVKNILLGNEKGEYLKSIDSYEQEIDASLKMNYKLWSFYDKNQIAFPTYKENIDYLKNFLNIRADWMKNKLDEMVEELH